MHDFVGIYEKAVPDELCDKLVEFFDVNEARGMTTTRQQDGAEKIKKDDSYIFNSAVVTDFPSTALTKDMWEELHIHFWQAYEKYADVYSVALTDSSAPHNVYSYKVQKTKIGQGYHVWHYEQATRENGARLLFYIIYLNDVDEGGETEFLYYAKRVKPKKGTILIAPAAFTHTHRGNPPLSNTKYIATGWVEF